MKNWVIAVFFLPQFALHAFSQPVIETRTLQSDQFKSVSISSLGGNVTVLPGVQQSIEIKILADRKPYLSTAEFNEVYEVICKSEHGKATLRIEKRKRPFWDFFGWDNSPRYAIEIKIPASIRLSAESVGGDVTISGITGDISAETLGGDLSLTNCSGVLNLETFGGDLGLQKVSGILDAETFGGDICGSYTSGQFELSTFGGDVTLTQNKALVKGSTFGGEMQISDSKK